MGITFITLTIVAIGFAMWLQWLTGRFLPLWTAWALPLAWLAIDVFLRFELPDDVPYPRGFVVTVVVLLALNAIGSHGRKKRADSTAPRPAGPREPNPTASVIAADITTNTTTESTR